MSKLALAKSTLNLFIGTPTVYMDNESDHACRADGTVSFAWDGINLSEYNSVIIMVGNNAYCVSLSEFSKPENIDGSLSVGLQLTDVPEDMEIKAYLSSGEFYDSTLDISNIHNQQ